MTILKSLRPTLSRARRLRSRTVEESGLQRLIKARFLRTAACGLLLAAAAPAAAHALSDYSAASDTLRATLSAPEGGTVAEGSTGHFEVSVAGSTAAGAVKIQYSVSGTAVAGEDYTALSGEATVSQGENTARIALEALKDGILDKGETVVLALTGATGPGTVLVDQTAATATIADNGTVSVELAAVSDTIGEGSAWNSSVIMSMPVADRISLRWQTQDGTALAGRDYKAADEVVTFQPGETVKPISVETLKDDNTEAVEVFYVSLGLGVDAARAGTEGAFKVDSKPQSAFIECSVAFPPNVQTIFEFDAPVPADTVIGTVAANTTGGIPYYQLDDGGENKFTINSLTAQISTTAALDPGLYELEVTVHDECGAQASIDVSVNVKQPNRPPVVKTPIENMKLFVGDKKEIDLSTVFSDPDEDVLSYEAVSSKPAVATAVVSGTTLTVTAKRQGKATVTVTAKDPDGLEVTHAFEVTVPNRPPKPVGTIEPDTINVGDSETVDVSSYFEDQDGDQLTYTARSSSPKVATVVVSGSEVTYTGKLAGSATVTVTADDGHGGTAQQRFLVTVEQPNRAPTTVGTIPADKIEVKESGSVDASSYFDDLDGDDLTYSATSSNANRVGVSVQGGEVTYTGKSAGSATVTVTADDGRGGTAQQKFLVTVEQPNRAPTTVGTIPADKIEVKESGSVDASSYFDDLDGDDLTYSATSSNANRVGVSVQGGEVTYTGKSAGSATVTVTADDGRGGTAQQKFLVTVEQPNRAPTTVGTIPADKIEVKESGSVDASSYFDDLDGDDLTYSATSSNANRVGVSVQGGEVTYTGKSAGSATVTVTADDGRGGTAQQKFLVTVEQPNRAPTNRRNDSSRQDRGQGERVGGCVFVLRRLGRGRSHLQRHVVECEQGGGQRSGRRGHLHREVGGKRDRDGHGRRWARRDGAAEFPRDG